MRLKSRRVWGTSSCERSASTGRPIRSRYCQRHQRIRLWKIHRRRLKALRDSSAIRSIPITDAMRVTQGKTYQWVHFEMRSRPLCGPVPSLLTDRSHSCVRNHAGLANLHLMPGLTISHRNRAPVFAIARPRCPRGSWNATFRRLQRQEFSGIASHYCEAWLTPPSRPPPWQSLPFSRRSQTWCWPGLHPSTRWRQPPPSDVAGRIRSFTRSPRIRPRMTISIGSRKSQLRASACIVDRRGMPVAR